MVQQGIGTLDGLVRACANVTVWSGAGSVADKAYSQVLNYWCRGLDVCVRVFVLWTDNSFQDSLSFVSSCSVLAAALG